MDRQTTADADVVIIGGGPAGATLACLLAQGGHTAIVVDRAAHPREHVGELLTPSVNAVLHRMDILTRVDSAGFVRRMGIGWTLPRMPRTEAFRIPVAEHPPPRALRRYGFNVERDAFDALLLQHACERGAQVLEGTLACRVLFGQGRAAGVEVRGPDGMRRVLTGHFVVDASGRRCLLGNQLKLLEARLLRPRCALYAWFRGVMTDSPGDDGYAFVHVLDRHRTWGWQIPLRDGVSSIGVVASCERFQGKDVDKEALFRRMIKENHVFTRQMADAQRVGPWHTVSDYSYQVRQLYGSGWLLLGDAGGFIDPIFASGVDIAMYSAVFAYESILPLLLLGRWRPRDEEFAFSSYERRVRQGTVVWGYAAELFNRSLRGLRCLVQDQQSIPAICRFLQGNPYEAQNQLIDQQLVDRMEYLQKGSKTRRVLADSGAHRPARFAPLNSGDS